MDRRSLIAAGVMFAALPMFATAAVHYEEGMVKKLLAEGKTVFIDYTTEWCTTCAAQKRTLAALKGENAAYEDHIVFVTADYDLFGGTGLAKELAIPRRSTLVVLKADQEVGRIVAGTSRKQIQGLLDAALAAAQADG